MAGINFEKFKSAQSVKAVARHCDKNQRKNNNHSNKNIDKTKTNFNQQGDLNYNDFCKKYDEKMRELDSKPGANKRSDRVTCIGIEIPTPEGLSVEREADFFKQCINVVRKQYGDDNVMQWYTHYDEQHAYVDSETKETRMSRNHVHIFVVPEVDGKLNAKKATSRSNMIRLNNAVHDMSVSEFGVAFNNGTRRASKKTVEELKAESEKLKDLEEREKALEEKEAEIAERDKVSDQNRLEAIRMKEQLKADRLALQLQQQAYEAEKRELDEREKKLEEEAEERVQEKEAALDEVLTGYADLKKQYDWYERYVKPIINGDCPDGFIKTVVEGFGSMYKFNDMHSYEQRMTNTLRNAWKNTAAMTFDIRHGNVEREGRAFDKTVQASKPKLVKHYPDLSNIKWGDTDKGYNGPEL